MNAALKNTPKVAVFLATYNGIRWLPEQVDSILGQMNVDVRLIVSDDISTDGTWEWLQELALRESRVTLLPRTKKFGSAAKNFYRLLMDSELAEHEFGAFADQDDIWEKFKLSRHATLLQENNYEAVSSNVIAFWDNGRTCKVVKSQPQRNLDFLFESPGPGCTFLMSHRLVKRMQAVLRDQVIAANDVALHDWLAYVVCRATGGQWYIDHHPSLLYRQHSSNEFGANVSLRAKLLRMKKISKGWYRNEVLKLVRISNYLNPDFHILV